MADQKVLQKSGTGLKRELSLVMCITLVIGATIGSGIFTMTGYGIALGGKSIGAAFILAALFVLVTNLPAIYQAGAIPATGGSYMYVSRFVHPTVGFIHILNALIGTFNIALMGTAFAAYFQSLLPSVDTRISAVLIIIILATVATFGVKMSGWFQNGVVIVMILALVSYIIPGLGKVQAQFITFGEAFFPSITQLGGIWAAMAILRYSLMGGGVIFSLGDEVKKPNFTIPAAFFIGTLVVTCLYALIGYVTVGVLPLAEVAGKPLSVAAAAVLGEGTGMFKFFVAGGALLGILTTLNASFMIYSRTHFAAARDGVWPKVFTKTNKYGVPFVTVWSCAVIGLVVILFKLSISELLNFVAVPGLIMGFLYYIPPIMIAYKLPNCSKKAWFRIPQPLLIAICIFAAASTFWMGSTLFSRMKPSHYIGMIIFYIIGFIYWYFRTKWLKKNGTDLIENMKGMHPYWIETENKLSE